MEGEFDNRQVRPVGLVVAGRRSEVTGYYAMRLNWRSENTIIGGSRIAIMTYDDLLEWFEGRVALLKAWTRVKRKCDLASYGAYRSNDHLGRPVADVVSL
jgi:hypothetical protein